MYATLLCYDDAGIAHVAGQTRQSLWTVETGMMFCGSDRNDKFIRSAVASAIHELLSYHNSSSVSRNRNLSRLMIVS